MLERWGTISWRKASQPAQRIAREGFVVDNHLASAWTRREKYPEASTPLEQIKCNAEASRIYLKEDCSPYQVGELLRNPDYAQTLEQLAEDGPEDFYRGDLARKMCADLATNGSFLIWDDFSSYQPRFEQSIAGTYRGYSIASSQPPHGGPTLLAILNILEGYQVARMTHNFPEYIYQVSMAMKAAFADRNRHLADPDFVDVPLEWMISKKRAQQWRDYIEQRKPIEVSFGSEPTDTTHVSVVDSEGNCVALTHSLDMSSGVITPGLGFMYNNSMVKLPSPPRTPELDRPAQRTHHRYDAHHCVPAGPTPVGHRSARCNTYHHLDSPSSPQRV